MNGLDYALIVLVSLSSLMGIVRGFAREVLSLVFWALAFWLSFHYTQALSDNLKSVISNDPLRTTLSFICIFLGVLIVGWVSSAIFSRMMTGQGMSFIDRVLGLVFGFIRGVLLVGILLVLANATALPKSTLWKNSEVVPELKDYVHWLSGWLPDMAKPHLVANKKESSKK